MNWGRGACEKEGDVGFGTARPAPALRAAPLSAGPLATRVAVLLLPSPGHPRPRCPAAAAAPGLPGVAADVQDPRSLGSSGCAFSPERRLRGAGGARKLPRKPKSNMNIPYRKDVICANEFPTFTIPQQELLKQTLIIFPTTGRHLSA
ncbi:PRKC apoptosis WT1 regulator protein-like [Equus quagga]|uniref:PRKC apoptosis WT1 regulator protein-like n=1 Tax=Equus quagga TaxID=89248 RepID=UPI001EE1ABE6|nr:PRKC apoptosis WT1 regulator protein-like [Equus quagga]